MQITNRHNLPTALARAARRDTYSRGASRKSVTQLISSPRIDVLREKHAAALTSDITDRIWSLLGTAVHHLLEAAAADGHVSEERLFTEINGWTISGAVDVQHEDAGPGIIDYKCTSVYSVMYDKPEWEHQLNSYAFLAWANKGIKIERLQICAILRDWRKSDAEKGDLSYPQQPIVMVEIPVWSTDEQLAFLTERVKLHQQAAAAADFGDELPLCTDEDRWIRSAKWAVFKSGGKRAVRVYDTETEAREEAEKLGGRVEKRGGEPKRCTNNYCGVAEWCSQWQSELSVASSGDS